MSDIITRLRDEDPEVPWTGPDGLFRQAAAEIERLRAVLRKLASGKCTHLNANVELLFRMDIARAALKEPKP